jgi:hypothetical protein
MTDDRSPTNLRDWQKSNVYEDGHSLLVTLSNAEIDLLLQIIEKQSEALDKIYSIDSKKHKDGSRELWGCGEIARTTQAEVQQIVERLVKDA